MDGWNASFLLGWPSFRCYISFGECIYNHSSKPCLFRSDTQKHLHRARYLHAGSRGLGGRIVKDPPIEGECVPHFFHIRVSRWTSKASELRFPSQILSVSWCWIILIPCPIKLLIPFVWKCFMKTAFLAAVSRGSQKTTLTYVLQQYKKNAPRTSWVVLFLWLMFQHGSIWRDDGTFVFIPALGFINAHPGGFLKNSLAEQKDKEAWESWRCWCKASPCSWVRGEVGPITRCK